MALPGRFAKVQRHNPGPNVAVANIKVVATLIGTERRARQRAFSIDKGRKRGRPGGWGEGGGAVKSKPWITLTVESQWTHESDVV